MKKALGILMVSLPILIILGALIVLIGLWETLAIITVSGIFSFSIIKGVKLL